MNSISEKMKTAAVTTAVKTAIDYLEKDPEANAVSVMDMVDALTPGAWYVPQRQAIR